MANGMKPTYGMLCAVMKMLSIEIRSPYDLRSIARRSYGDRTIWEAQNTVCVWKKLCGARTVTVRCSLWLNHPTILWKIACIRTVAVAQMWLRHCFFCANAGAPNELIFLYELKTSVLIFIASWILKWLNFLFWWFMVCFCLLKWTILHRYSNSDFSFQLIPWVFEIQILPYFKTISL